MSDLGALKQQVEDLRGDITRKRDEKEYSIEDLAASASNARNAQATAPKPRRHLRGHFGPCRLFRGLFRGVHGVPHPV